MSWINSRLYNPKTYTRKISLYFINVHILSSIVTKILLVLRIYLFIKSKKSIVTDIELKLAIILLKTKLLLKS